MAADNMQKIKLLKLYELLRKETDEQHPISRVQLCRRLNEMGISSNVRTLSLDIRVLRENGYEIEMDDFGAGYSSLNMISSLPIDVLKMDMGFIRNIKEDNRELRLVELILDIARYMDVPVVAEGVETEEQLELLRKANCRYVQGYYFSRPLPAQEFEHWIEQEIVQKEGRYSL